MGLHQPSAELKEVTHSSKSGVLEQGNMETCSLLFTRSFLFIKWLTANDNYIIIISFIFIFVCIQLMNSSATITTTGV